MQRTYEEMFPNQDFSHLALTVEQYFSANTPVWWVEEAREQGSGSGSEQFSPLPPAYSAPVACVWVGNAIDQLHGDRHAHIFLLYVAPEHRRRGIGSTLMNYVENWVKQKGDALGEQSYRQIGLQVFQSNTPALQLYHQLGYQTQSLWMVKSLR